MRARVEKRSVLGWNKSLDSVFDYWGGIFVLLTLVDMALNKDIHSDISAAILPRRLLLQIFIHIDFWYYIIDFDQNLQNTLLRIKKVFLNRIMIKEGVTLYLSDLLNRISSILLESDFILSRKYTYIISGIICHYIPTNMCIMYHGMYLYITS